MISRITQIMVKVEEPSFRLDALEPHDDESNLKCPVSWSLIAETKYPSELIQLFTASLTHFSTSSFLSQSFSVKFLATSWYFCKQVTNVGQHLSCSVAFISKTIVKIYFNKSFNKKYKFTTNNKKCNQNQDKLHFN